MSTDEVIEVVLALDAGLELKRKWGEDSLFYNPGNSSPHGTYVLTLKHRDGPNDRASQLDREGIYRVSVGPGRDEYRRLFGDPPARPGKGGVVTTGDDFTRPGVWMPHPVYAWMSWVCILSPGPDARQELIRLAGLALDRARATERGT